MSLLRKSPMVRWHVPCQAACDVWKILAGCNQRSCLPAMRQDIWLVMVMVPVPWIRILGTVPWIMVMVMLIDVRWLWLLIFRVWATGDPHWPNHHQAQLVMSLQLVEQRGSLSLSHRWRHYELDMIHQQLVNSSSWTIKYLWIIARIFSLQLTINHSYH